MFINTPIFGVKNTHQWKSLDRVASTQMVHSNHSQFDDQIQSNELIQFKILIVTSVTLSLFSARAKNFPGRWFSIFYFILFWRLGGFWGDLGNFYGKCGLFIGSVGYLR